MDIGVLFSSGKDSCHTIDYYLHQSWHISCLITIVPSRPSWMFQKPIQRIITAQAQAMGIPLVTQRSRGEKEQELAELRQAIQRAKERYGIHGVAVGALASDYQHERVNRICEELGLRCFAPLWHVSQSTIMRRLVQHGFDVRMVSVSAMGLDASWIGRRLTDHDINRLEDMQKRFGLHVAGEGGEFETIVLDAPFFRQRIDVRDAKVIQDAEYEAHWEIGDVLLTDKGPQ